MFRSPIALCVLLSGCSWFSGPPVEEGSMLTYRIVEKQREAKREQTLSVRFTASDEVKDAFKLDVLAEFGGRTLNVFKKDLTAARETDDALEFPLAFGGAMDPGAIWLPTSQRQNGAIGLAGLTRRITTYRQFEAWELQAPDGLSYYAVESGLLVGFVHDRVDINITGTLMNFKK